MSARTTTEGRRRAVYALWLTLWAWPAFGQFQRLGVPAETVPTMSIVPPGRDTLLVLAQSQEALKQGRTADALALLQRLLDLSEDYFTDKSMQRTLKTDALRILADLSPSERDAYELVQGTAARALLSEALARGDSDRLAEVMRRYPATQAGVAAAEWLALEAWDHGRVRQAATLLSQLRAAARLAPSDARRIGVREVFAWHQAGEPSRAAERLWQLTSGEDLTGVRVSGEGIPKFSDAAHAGRWLSRVAGPPARYVELETEEWLGARGSASGAAVARETGPIGGPVWRRDHLSELEADLPPKKGSPPEGLLPQFLDLAEAPLKEQEQVAWPTTLPLAAGNVTVFRTARDIVALDRHTGNVRWRSVLVVPEFAQLWKDFGQLTPDSALTEYLRQRLYNDATYGSLSSDGRYVFAVDGLEYPVVSQGAVPNNGRIFRETAEAELSGFNRLTAYELAGGRLAWEIGGERAETAGEFGGHFFLGPPLSADGKLFVLAEVQGEIRLLALEAHPSGAEKVWSQPLVIPALNIARSEERRREGLTPASSHGVVVCPTATGAVIAVDVASRRLLWAYTYASTRSPVVPGMHPMLAANLGRMNRPTVVEEGDRGWRDGNPVIAEGRVFVAPTDSDELHCLDLSEGKLLWAAPRDRGLFLAGADAERVLIVCPDRIDAVRATDGAPLWTAHLPLPSGRGVWMANRYLLPLSTGEIASLELATGRLLARSKLPGGDVPGNLAAAGGALVSVSSRAVVGFASLQEIERDIARRLNDDPGEVSALARRGELRLHRGDFQAGLEDLRAAIVRRADPYAKSVLAAALLEGLRTDFARYRDSVSELDQLTDDLQQRQEFVWLTARGLEQAGEPVAALERMTRLMDQSLDDFAQESFGSPWQARNDRKLAGLFERLYRQASESDRRTLDQLILSRLPTSTEEGAIDGLRRYLRVFEFHPSAVGARQRLAERLDPATDVVEYDLTWTRLAQHQDPAISGPAAGTLAQWYLSRRRFDDAARWIATLEERFADVECGSGVTGKELAARLRSDADFADFTRQPLPWPQGVIETRPAKRQMNESPMARVAVIGQRPEHYQGWSFETDQRSLVARDAHGRQRWRLTRGTIRPVEQYLPPTQHRVALHGHLVGWSNGNRLLVAADLEPERSPPRILWEESLVPPGTSPFAMVNVPARVVPFRGGGAVIRIDATPAGTGALFAITDHAVVYHNGRKLFAADPTTGKLLWSRKDLPRWTYHAAADDQVVAYVVQGQAAAEGRGGLTLLRTLDGEHVAAADPPAGIIEWIGGSRVVRTEDPARPTLGAVPLEVWDVVRGETVWKAELSRPAAIRVVNAREVFTIEENRRVTLRNLDDGTIRWTQELSLEVAVDALFVQPWRDRYLAVLGKTTPEPGGPRLVGFTNDDVPVNGHVAAFERGTGELLWSHRLEEGVFDAAQPAGWPVLVFAGKKYVLPRARAAPPSIVLATTLLDKQTGKLIHQSSDEPSSIATYFVDVDPDRNRISVNFLTWSIDVRYTGRKE